MILFLIYGLFVFNDYNLSTDEEIERWTGLINYKAMMQIEDIEIGNVDFSSLPDLAVWRDRYYGAAAQYIPLFVEHIFGFQMETHRIYQIRHLFTFGMFWLASVTFYFLCRRLGAEKEEALLGILLLILSPRILGDSFYNIKDSVFMSIVIVNLYVGICFMDHPTMLKTIGLAMVSAVCVNVRVLGAEVLAFCLIATGIQGIQKKQTKRYIEYCLVAALLSVVGYVIITPVTWDGVFEAIIGVLSTFSNYSPWTGLNYFQGQPLYAWELPWYYIPLWVITTTPLLVLVLAAVGTWYYGEKLQKKQIDLAHWIVILYVMVPLVYAVLRTPALYNGWRHFYFIYPGVVLAAVYGWHRIRKCREKHQTVVKVFTVGVGACLLSTAGWVVQNHPYECTYFNVLSRKYAAENMEKDYWKMAHQDAILWIAENDTREHITIHGGYIDYLPEGATKERFEQVSWENADYVIYSNVTDEKNERFDGYDLWERKGIENFWFDGFAVYDQIYQIETSGIEICRVYQRVYNKNEGAHLKYKGSTLYYDSNGMQWNVSKQNGQMVFEGKTAELLAPDRIGLQCNDKCQPVRIELSEDGSVWRQYEPAVWRELGETYLLLDLESEKTQYIRLVFDENELMQQQEFEWNLSFCYRTDTPITWRDSLAGVTGVAASENQWSQGFAVDGDMNTRWDSGISQRQGISFSVELEENIILGGISLDHGAYTDDYPRDLVLYGSTDGVDWEKISLEKGAFSYYGCSPTNVRHLTLELQEESSWNWSICEIKLWIVAQ